MRSACESGPRPGPALFYYLRRPTTDRRSGGVMKGKATRAMTTEATPVINTRQIDTAVLTDPRLIAETGAPPRIAATVAPVLIDIWLRLVAVRDSRLHGCA